MKSLKDFNFGNVDGKNETSKNSFSLDSFFNHEKIYEKLEEGKYLILGNKGTGKSFLLEYFRKRKEKEGNIFSHIYLEDFFSKKNLIQSKNEFLDSLKLLEWIIYIELAKVILEIDIINNNSKEVKILNDFMKKNEFELKLDTNRIVENSLEKGVKGNLEIGKKSILSCIFEKLRVNKTKEEYGKYYEYIDDLKAIIIKILKNNWKSQNHIFIIFDELDNINDLNKDTYNILLNLVKISSSLNHDWDDKGIKIKILIGMRLDIYLKLNSTYTNKIKEDFGIVLSWGKEKRKDSPLFKMIFHKMRIEDESIKNLNDLDIFKNLFPDFVKIHGKKIKSYKYILDKTLLRPRDIISFFNKAKYICPEKSELNQEDLQRISIEFSDYFYTELRNQGHGLMDIELFDEGIKLLKNYRKTIFSYPAIKEYLNENKDIFNSINKSNLQNVISHFFEIGLLGNMKQINGHESKKGYYKYFDDVELNMKEDFVVHYGIRPYLKLSIENNLSN